MAMHIVTCYVNIRIMMTSSNGNIFRVTDPLCREFTGPGEFPTQRPVTLSFDVFFGLRLNKRLSKQPLGWWFETPSWSLWRQCYDHGCPQRMIGMYTRHDMEMLSASLVPCEENPPTSDRFSSQRTGMLSFTIMISIWKQYIQLWCNLCLSQNMLTKNSRRARDLRRYDAHMASLHWMNWSFGNMECSFMKIMQ